MTDDKIKEIAEQMDLGFRCFIHKKTEELLFIPDTLKNPEMDLEAWEEENDKLENNFFDYFEIEALQSNDSFRIMEDFVDTLDDSNRLKDRLYSALNKPKPFRNFKNEIDYSGEYRQKWFDFKNQWLMDWVRKELERFENIE